MFTTVNEIQENVTVKTMHEIILFHILKKLISVCIVLLLWEISKMYWKLLPDLTQDLY